MLKKMKYLILLMPVALLLIAACDSTEEDSEQIPSDSLDDTEDSEENTGGPSVVNNFSMETEDDSYPQETEQITVIISNNTNEDTYYGVEFRVDKQVNGEWEEVPFEEEMAFIQIAHDLPAGEQTEEVIDLTLYEDYLEPGEYRAVKLVNGQELHAHFSIE